MVGWLIGVLFVCLWVGGWVGGWVDGWRVAARAMHRQTRMDDRHNQQASSGTHEEVDFTSRFRLRGLGLPCCVYVEEGREGEVR
jgi:hypothetical protein